MNQHLFSLPKGCSELSGAKSSNGWVLAWKELNVWSWNHEKGWTPLPEIAAEVKHTYVSSSGILIQCFDEGRNKDFFGHWSLGREEWDWWEEKSHPHKTFFSSPDILMLPYGDGIRVYKFDHTGLKKVLTFPLENISEQTFWQPNYSISCLDAKKLTNFEFINNEGLNHIELAYSPEAANKQSAATYFSEDVSLKSILNFTESSVSAYADYINISSNWLIEDTFFDGCARHANKTTGQLENLGLLNVKGAACLWEAYFNNDKKIIKEILKVLQAYNAVTEISINFGRSLFDVLFDNNLSPTGVICASGIFLPEKHSLVDNEARTFSGPSQTWQCFLAPEKYLPTYFEELIRGMAPEKAVQIIIHYCGEKSCELLLNYVRSAESTWMVQTDGIRQLFSSNIAPAQGRDLILQSFSDTNLNVRKIAAAASGALCPQQNIPLFFSQEFPPPRQQLLSILETNDRECIEAAIDSMVALGINDVSNQLLPHLKNSDAAIRTAAVTGLGSAADITKEQIEETIKLAFTDTEEMVRKAVLNVLGGKKEKNTIAPLIQFLGDWEWNLRGEAADQLVKKFADLSDDQYWQLADLVLFLLMVAPMYEDSSDYTLNIDSFFSSIVDNLEETYPSVDWRAENIDLKNEQQVKIARTIFLLFYLTILDPENSSLEIKNFSEEGFDFLMKLVKSIGCDTVIREEELDALQGAPSVKFLGKLATNIHKHDPELGTRLCALVNAKTDASKIREAVPDTTGYSPLHQRLRQKTLKTSPENLCREITTQLSQTDFPAAATALVALIRSNDLNAFESFQRRIVNGDGIKWPVMSKALIQIAPDNKRSQIISSILSSPRVNIFTKLLLVDDTMAFGDALENIAPEAKKALCKDVINSEHPLEVRIEAAGDYCKLGGDDFILDFWEKIAPAVDFDTEKYRYARAVQFALCNDNRYMGDIQGKWIERGDLDALQAFANCGTPKDYTEMRKALELGADEERIRATVDAIHARYPNSPAFNYDS